MLSTGLLLLGAVSEVSGKTTLGRVVIGGAIQETGKFASYGTQAKNIMEMWKEKMDADDEFPFNISFNFADGSSKDLAKENIQAMLVNRTDDSPDVVIPPYTSGSSKAVCDDLDDNGHEVICGVWGGASESIFAQPKAKEQANQTTPSSNLRVQTFGVAGNYFSSGLQYAHDMLKTRSIGRDPTVAFIWRETDAFSKSLCVGARAKAQALGFDITLDKDIDPLETASGGDSIYQKMKDCDGIGKVPFVDLYDVTQRALNPLVEGTELADVIVGCGLYDSQTSIILGLIARRIRPAFTLMTNVADKKLLSSALPLNVLDIFMPTQWTPTQAGTDEVFGTGMDFYKNYETKFGGTPTYHGASMGGFLVMLTRALKHSSDSHWCSAGECELNATALREAFRAQEVDKNTFYGLVDIDEYGANMNKPVTQVQMQLGENGSFVQVPAAPLSVLPADWIPSPGTTFPRWPARTWSEAKTDFVNSYCGSAGMYIDDFDALRVGLNRASNYFKDFGTFGASGYPEVGDVTSCTQCPLGKNRPLNFGECYDCPAGSFAANLGQSECTLCDVGFAVGTTGSASCQSCAKGRVAGERGLDKCQQCHAGRFMSQEGKSVCDDCPVGKYQADAGQSECDVCVDAAGQAMTTQYKKSTGEAECICGEGRFMEEGTQVCRDVCPEGEFFSITKSKCEMCPLGMTCLAGMDAPTVKAGNWAHSSDDKDRNYDVYRCRNKHECPGGPAGTCAEGRDPNSVGCADCMDGYVVDSKGHTCQKCEGVDVLPLILFLLVAMGVLCCMAYYSTVNVMKTNMNTLVALAIAGQLVIAVQWLTVFGELDLTWEEPFASVIKFAAVVSFDFESLKFGCIIPSSSEVTIFVVRLLCFPIGALILVTMMFIKAKVTKQAMVVDQVVNSVGLILVVLFLSLTMVAFTPFICVDSPNGTMSMLSNPSVQCDDNGDFITLAVFGVIGLFVYSVTPLAMASYTTYRYPSLVASGRGSMIMNRYRFLFQRFTVERYYYAPLFLLRNFLIALVPVMFSNFQHLQAVVMGAMFVMFSLVSAFCRPWRGMVPNVLEATLMGHFVVALMVAGMLMEIDRDAAVEDFKVVLTLLMIGSIVPFCGIGGYLAYKKFTIMTSKDYGMFLSHHKLAMAAGARLVKMELSRRTGKRIFLDSDELDDLDGILNTVRVRIECLVVLLTTETLWRPWCAGEICTAHMNGVPIVSISSDGYAEPTDEELEVKALSVKWTAEDFAPMALQGVTFEAVRGAYLFMRDMAKIQWKRAGAPGNQHVALQNMTEGLLSAFYESKCVSKKGGSKEPIPDVDGASNSTKSEVIVVANGEDGEAISCAQVLARMIRSTVHLDISWAFSSDELSNQQDPDSVIVCLTKDCLNSVSFAKMLLGIQTSFGGRTYLMTTRSPDFQFPVSEVLASIQAQLVGSMGVGLEQVQAAFQPVLSSLALPFFASARESLVVAEARAISDRLGRKARAATPKGSKEPPAKGDNGNGDAKCTASDSHAATGC